MNKVIFSPRETIALNQRGLLINAKTMLSARGLARDLRGRFIITDVETKTVVVLNNNGELIKKIGKEGVKPGEFKVPTAVTTDNKNNVYVMDHIMRRINIFDSEGNFITSFILFGYHSQPFVIMIRDGYLFAGAPHPEKNTFIQVYSLKGEYLNSFCKVSRNSIKYFVAEVDFDIYNNSLYVIQSGDYEIRVYNFDGTLLKTFGVPPKYFMPVRKKRSEDIHKWFSSWTSLSRICISPKDKLVLIQLTMNNLIKGIETKYVIDIYTLDGEFIGNFMTNDALLCADENGFVYFLRFEEKGKNNYVANSILKYEIKR